MSGVLSESPVLSAVEGKGEILVWQGPGGWNPDLGQVEPGKEFRVGRDITAEQAESFRHWGLMESRPSAGPFDGAQDKLRTGKDEKGAKGAKEMGSREDAKTQSKAQDED